MGIGYDAEVTVGSAPPAMALSGPLAPAVEMADPGERDEAYPLELPPEVDPAELVELCALDTELYNRTFFPTTFRQPSPAFHQDIYRKLESRVTRFFGAKVFRGGAKTTLLRAHTSKRIAYGTSRTIMFVGKSQDHAIRSVRWVKRAVEHNRQWAGLFGLERGEKWTEEAAEIRHRVLEHPITVLAYGMTGSIRGINIDDYRPDLIVVDDPQDEENSATPEQREKIEKLFFGALAQSLAPVVDCPDSKLVLLQTPLHPLDLISTASKDPTWQVSKYGILDESGQSVWPERYPTFGVLAERQAYADRGQLPLWTREKMCEIISSETSMFRQDWLQYWDTLPPRMVTVIGIDPVPPPSQREIAAGFKDKDFESISVVGVSGGNYYLLEYASSRGHTPDWLIAKFFEFTERWRPVKVRVEGIAYQKTLAWILEREMRARSRYVQINSDPDRRSKPHRLAQTFSGIASNKRLFIHRTHLEFVRQFVSYPNVEHEDLLDATAFAVMEAMKCHFESGEDTFAGEEQKPLPQTWRAAP